MSNSLTRASPLFLVALLFIAAYFLIITLYPMSSAKMLEGFSSAPTRATDCRCLPGYLPSNSNASSQYGGEFQHYGGTVFFAPFRSKERHWIPTCVMCGINVCDPSVYKDVSKEIWDKVSVSFGPTYTCDILKQAQESSKMKGTFFCQNTSDPTKTMSCY